MNKVYLGLGSNLGNRQQLLQQSIEMIKEQIGEVISQSALYVTEPWGFESAHPFLNAVVCCETSLNAFDILEQTQRIERQLGRQHKSINGQYTDRCIDIDLLLVNDEIIQTPQLTLPHPLMHKRQFVLEPLCEIAPDLMHPTLKVSISQLLQQQLG